MGKKKGGNRKKDDYWDTEFAQDAEVIQAKAEEDNEAFQEKAAAFGALVGDDDDDQDGGLMAMVNKAAKSKVKKNKKNKGPVDDAPSTTDSPEAPASSSPEKVNEAAPEVEDDWADDKKKKKNKSKNAKKEEPVKAPASAEPEEPGRILSKKEKEKLKKERQKEEKRRQAALKRDQEAQEGKDEQTEPKPEPTKSTEEAVKAEPAAPAAPATTGTAAKGKKKLPAGLGALQKIVEERKRAEELARKQEEEERKRIEEEQRRVEEEEAKLAEQRRIKKEKEKAKKEQLRKEGKLLTKAQKEDMRRAELRRQQMLEAGNIKIAAFEDPSGTKKRPVYGKRKKPKATDEEKKKQEEEKKRAEEEAANSAQASKEPSDVEEDWENAAVDSEDEDIKAKSKSAKEDEDDDDSLKDDWEDESEEEVETKAPASKQAETKKTSAPPKPKDDGSSEVKEAKKSEPKSQSAPAAAPSGDKKADAPVATKESKEDSSSVEELRSPICCILGHVDTGKTKLLDKIRQTNVQEGEAGGITQQIGATYFPGDAIEKKTAVLGAKRVEKLKVPGLLIIDTPGHESFTNLRSRGSSLCNIAILVVDIMHGLEPQTLESIRLLRDRRTPFIVALNKIDRLFGWKATPDNAFEDSLAKQDDNVKEEFDTRVTKTIVAFAEQGLNAQLYYKNKNFAKYVSLVPTSAHTGEGIPDMLNLLINLTQQRMSNKLMYLSELECTVLEVKVIEGFGTTIDVILVNGWLHEGDTIVVCGLNGPIVTQVRALLTPQPMRELRIKSQYVHHKSVKAALGVKIAAPDLEKTIAGSRLLVLKPEDDEDELREEVMADLTNLLGSVDRTGHGVWVQASTLGALEALLEFLRTSKIPVAGINIGPVHKKDVTRASVMVDKAPQFAVMLCFDVKVDRDAEELAAESGIKVFKADIIYHLFDRFQEHSQAILEQKRKDLAPKAVFPSILRIIPGAVFNKRDPIVVGIDIVEGALRLGTPICVVRKDPETNTQEIISLGRVTSMEQNHQHVEIVKKGTAGAGVAIKIECPANATPKLFGKHVFESDLLYSHITRQSIDALKDAFRNELSRDEWILVAKLKKTLGVD